MLQEKEGEGGKGMAGKEMGGGREWVVCLTLGRLVKENVLLKTYNGGKFVYGCWAWGC